MAVLAFNYDFSFANVRVVDLQHCYAVTDVRLRECVKHPPQVVMLVMVWAGWLDAV